MGRFREVLALRGIYPRLVPPQNTRSLITDGSLSDVRDRRRKKKYSGSFNIALVSKLYVELITVARSHQDYEEVMDYDSDSSGLSDQEEYTETGVLLGYSSKEPTDDHISHLGGHPVRSESQLIGAVTLTRLPSHGSLPTHPLALLPNAKCASHQCLFYYNSVETYLSISPMTNDVSTFSAVGRKPAQGNLEAYGH